MKIIKISKGMIVKVDDEDFEFLSQWKWCAHTSRHAHTWYAKRNQYSSILGKERWENIGMHRLIMNAPSHLHVHHKNGDGLDNQKHNLCLCTPQENHSALRHRKPSASKYRGVTKSGKKWTANMQVNYKHVYLGTFPSEEDAAKARDRYAFSLYKEMAYLNFS